MPSASSGSSDGPSTGDVVALADLVGTGSRTVGTESAPIRCLRRVWGYFRNLLVVLSARTLPPVWQVGQYATV